MMMTVLVELVVALGVILMGYATLIIGIAARVIVVLLTLEIVQNVAPWLIPWRLS